MAIEDDWRQAEYPASDPRNEDPAIYDPGAHEPVAKRPNYTAFISVFGIPTGAVLSLLAFNGFNVNWIISTFCYIACIACYVWTFWVHVFPHRHILVKISVMIGIVFGMGYVCFKAVSLQYVKDHSKSPVGAIFEVRLAGQANALIDGQFCSIKKGQQFSFQLTNPGDAVAHQ